VPEVLAPGLKAILRERSCDRRSPPIEEYPCCSLSSSSVSYPADQTPSDVQDVLAADLAVVLRRIPPYLKLGAGHGRRASSAVVIAGLQQLVEQRRALMVAVATGGPHYR
jgi:hypothetical protein